MTVAVMADEKREKKDTDVSSGQARVQADQVIKPQNFFFQICDQFDSLHKKPLKHCADLFGYDTLTKDYVK